MELIIVESMRRLKWISFFSFFIFGFSIPKDYSQPLFAAEGKTIQATSSTGPIVLDGRLEEADWQRAQVQTLVQQSPHPGESTPFLTEVRVLKSSKSFYFGFRCSDPDPRRMAAHSMQRDNPMEGDDMVGIVLDAYGDKRTGYFFMINVAGARSDGLISDPEHPSYDWDGIWDARVSKSPDGWSAEVEIPFQTLSFTYGLKSWGLNFQRFVGRERLMLRWTSPTLDSFFYDLSRAGELTGVEDIRQGHGLEISPYGIGRLRSLFPQDSRILQGTGGGEVTWKVTPQMVTVLTLNTDFAETEVDSRQLNITRFPLFLPEKRSFFLEGANQYEFGLGVGEQFIPFFSRRIGLFNGEPVPIDMGVKLNGRAGRWNLAMLDVQTRATTISSGQIPGVNLFAGRISYDLSNKLRIGTLVTNGDPEGVRKNSFYGLDAVWRTSTFRGNKNLLVGGWTGASGGDHKPGSRAGWGFKIDYPNDFLDCGTSANRYGDGLDPLLGFLPRPGVRYFQGGCRVQPRPSREGALRRVRQFSIGNYYEQYTNMQGITESWKFTATPLIAQLESGDQIETEIIPQFERLLTPFEIVPGIHIPAGSYQFNRWNFHAISSEHRPWHAGVTASFGSFYGGTLDQWDFFSRWASPAGHLQLGFSANGNFGHLPQGNFAQRLWQANFSYAWNPNLILTSFIQYDSESQNLGTNTRLRWTFKPGNDLFIVWNRGWQRLILSPHELSLIPESEMFAVKLRFTFRL